MIPIPGATKIASVLSSAGAADLALTGDDVAEIDRHVGFPA